MDDLTRRTPVEIVLLLASPLHRYEGRPTDGAVHYDGVETPESIEIRAGRGIVGDRYFNRPAHKHAAVTVMSADGLDDLARELGLDFAIDGSATRRNILIRGADIDALARQSFALDSGDGPVRFQGNRPANPCAWMDQMVAPGAFRGLRGRGGVRCEPLSDGVLRLGEATLLTA
jgi:MOSC domain-containing protein YiiM